MYLNLIQHSGGVEFDVSSDAVEPQTAPDDIYHCSFKIEKPKEEVVAILQALLQRVAKLSIRKQIKEIKKELSVYLIIKDAPSSQ